MSMKRVLAHNRVCGVDEAGRGAFAGPMVIASVVLLDDIEGIDDSKKLTPKKREELYEKIIKNSLFRLFFIPNSFIDEFGLSLPIKNTLEKITKRFSSFRVIMDGNTNFKVDSVEAIIRADESIKEVGAASILAKVARDRYMCKISKLYPNYQLCKHKGYGTKLHKEMILKYGYSKIHRKRFQFK